MKKLYSILLAIILTNGILHAQSDSPCPSTTIPTDGSCVTGQTTIGSSATFAGAGPGCLNANYHDVWYSFTATDNGFSLDNLTATSNTGKPMEAILYSNPSGDCATFTQLWTSGCSTAFPISGTYTGLTPGQTYYLAITNNKCCDHNFKVCVTVSTVATTAPNVNCTTATPLCSSTTQQGNSDGFGSQELNATNSGCLGLEHQASWYTFTALTSGSFQINISPQNGTDDYDFAMWNGATSGCPPTTAPMRCSYAAGGGSTGMNSTTAGSSTEYSESALGDRWISDATVTAGVTYILLIDNFSSTTSPFDLNFGGTATWNCTVLSMTLKKFNAEAHYDYNTLIWTTASERNNDYFIVEGSTDGYVFQQLGTVKGSGTTNTDRSYSFKADNPQKVVNYYRLTTVDENGSRVHYQSVSVDNKTAVVLLKTYNMLGQEVEAGTKGLVFEYYSDGTTKKVYR